MNRVALVCAAFAAVFLGGLLLTRSGETKIIPYYVQHSLAAPQSPAVPAPKSIFQNPPSMEKIKKDLSGKVVYINGHSHQFFGPELHQINILNYDSVNTGCMFVDVQVVADATIVERTGLVFRREHYSHENVSGSLRVYYEKKDVNWQFHKVESINLTKMVTPNAKAPPSVTQVWKYVN